MASNFKFKLLSHLTQKKEEKGFTLIELLVVVIIIGVLAAIALPNLLNQVGKARMSEGKTTLGAINRGQQVYRTENPVFASAITSLDTKVPASGKYFSFAASGAGSTAVTNTATALAPDGDNTTTITTAITYTPADGTFTLTNGSVTPSKSGNW
ncbi:prepilin-type N-terminal cleavage/methylation domain-containing protein [Synechocystis sp. FACHB-383]|uniref:type IV pilin protein n=1 Tax=Synechocystis sp. FACHB-383 TaxID=2692864 RepID=UPI00168950C5|nr:type IV pilin-like G/H family protein [Synechocystis sp. FACHB-383]MBD2654408.1 prepilin-type N-terminal cleavage/methylation domain-containing protein [Synechocystis sp. FACHB-383]